MPLVNSNLLLPLATTVKKTRQKWKQIIAETLVKSRVVARFKFIVKLEVNCTAIAYYSYTEPLATTVKKTRQKWKQIISTLTYWMYEIRV